MVLGLRVVDQVGVFGLWWWRALIGEGDPLLRRSYWSGFMILDVGYGFF